MSNRTKLTPQEVKEHEAFLEKVDNKIDAIQAKVADSAFGREDETTIIANAVHKECFELKNILEGDEESSYPVWDSSPATIKKLFDYDIELLTKCQSRIGGPCGTKLNSPQFKRVMADYISGLEAADSRKRNLSMSSPSRSEIQSSKHSKPGAGTRDGDGSS